MLHGCVFKKLLKIVIPMLVGKLHPCELLNLSVHTSDIWNSFLASWTPNKAMYVASTFSQNVVVLWCQNF